MPFQIVRQDITQITCDAIVNPTDRIFSGSGGVDYAVHIAAGAKLDEACQSLNPISFGEVTVTDAYNLPCKHIIHTVGPIWTGGCANEAVLLRSCYINALFKACDLEVQSVAFPLISAGTYGFPKDKVLKIALSAFSDFLNLLDSDMDIILCAFDKTAYEISQKIELEQYLKSKDVPIESGKSNSDSMGEYHSGSANSESEYQASVIPGVLPKSSDQTDNLTEWIKKQDDTFAVMLLKLIDKKGMTDVGCYKKANVKRSTFWKIMNMANYKPSKITVLSFAIALELTLQETETFLKSAGFSLSHSNVFDMIVEFYITRGIYSTFEINAALYDYNQQCLGC